MKSLRSVGLIARIYQVLETLPSGSGIDIYATRSVVGMRHEALPDVPHKFVGVMQYGIFAYVSKAPAWSFCTFPQVLLWQQRKYCLLDIEFMEALSMHRAFYRSTLLIVLLLGSSYHAFAEREPLAVWDWWSQSSPGHAAWFAWVEQEFEKANPDIDVQFVFQSWGVYLERLATSLATGDPPDVLHLPVGWGRELFEQGILQNLAGYISRSPDQHLRNFVPVARHYVTASTAQFGVPLEFDATTLVYNRSINKEVGMHEDAPRSVANWNDFVTMAKRLTRRDADKITRSGYSFWLGMEVFTSWLAANGSALYTPDRTSTTLTSKAALETLTYLKALASDHQVFSENAADFYTGQSAIYSWGTWSGQMIERDMPDLDFGMASFPKGPSSKSRGLAGWTNMLSIPKFVRNTDAAWRYVAFCTSTQAQIRLAILGAKPTPARLEYYTSEQYNQLLRARRWMLVFPEAASVAQPIIFYRSVEVNSIANRLFSQLTAGKISPSDALSELESQVISAWNR